MKLVREIESATNDPDMRNTKGRSDGQMHTRGGRALAGGTPSDPFETQTANIQSNDMKYLNSAEEREPAYPKAIDAPGGDGNANLKYSNSTWTQISWRAVGQITFTCEGGERRRSARMDGTVAPRLSIAISLNRLNCLWNKSNRSVLTAPFVLRMEECHCHRNTLATDRAVARASISSVAVVSVRFYCFVDLIVGYLLRGVTGLGGRLSD